jgi:HSP20 family molecular chaperone IbpA
MLELLEWKERELKNLKRDLFSLVERFMNFYGIASEELNRGKESTIQFYDEQNRFQIEIYVPQLESETLRVYLTGDVLLITGQRRIPHVGLRAYRKVIELPFSPREGEINVNYRDDRLIVQLMRPRKKVYKVRITAS